MLEFIHKYEWKMEFSKIGQDLSLDFVKGVAIILVLLNHSTSLAFHQDSWFFIWGYPAVPLFLLIQVFHAYKKGFDGIHLRMGRIFKRVIFPFFLVEVILCAIAVFMYPTIPIREILISGLYWGGKGPGSYYPWIYIQFAILLPLLRPVFRHVSERWLLALFLVLSIGSEVLCSVMHIPDWTYRLLFSRYIFLIYLGYRLVIKGVSLNILAVMLSFISLIAVYNFEMKDFQWYPWFHYVAEWRTCHWICYFYIAYLILFLLCKFFYWLPAGNWIENAICKTGQHSYAIYIFQLLYFYALAPFLKDGLSLIGSPSVEEALYIILSILSCTWPVLRFVSGLSDRTIMLKVTAVVLAITTGVTLVGWKWRPFYTAPSPISPYQVFNHQDDTLRVVMIGDSWVYFHQTLRRDSTFEEQLKKVLGNRKAKVTAKGKGGAVSGEIYQRMSAERTMAMDFDLNYCSQSVIEAGADYCVISAGINDARQRRGKPYYVNSYLRIVRLLLSYGIRPVVMELPEVDVDEAFDGNTLYYRLRARICMYLLDTNLRGVGDYRQVLKDSLESQRLMDSVIYIPADSWNPEGWHDRRDIYTDDHFHLNLAGYEILDSTFATEIVKDYRLRKKR